MRNYSLKNGLLKVSLTVVLLNLNLDLKKDKDGNVLWYIPTLVVFKKIKISSRNFFICMQWAFFRSMILSGTLISMVITSTLFPRYLRLYSQFHCVSNLRSMVLENWVLYFLIHCYGLFRSEFGKLPIHSIGHWLHIPLTLLMFTSDGGHSQSWGPYDMQPFSSYY